MGVSPEETGASEQEDVTSEVSDSSEHVSLTRIESERQLADSFGYVEEITVPALQEVSKTLGKYADNEDVVNGAAGSVRELLRDSPKFPTDDKLREIALGRAESRAREFLPIAKILQKRSIDPGHDPDKVTHLNPSLAKAMVEKFKLGSSPYPIIRMGRLLEIDLDTVKALRISMQRRRKEPDVAIYLSKTLIEKLPEDEKKKFINSAGDEYVKFGNVSNPDAK